MSEGSTNEIRSFPGLVKAASDTKLAFRVGGPLIQFDVRIGQRVVKGDVIARIDPRDFEINVMRLTATLDEARANLKAMRVGARAEDIALLEADLRAAQARLTEAKNSHKRYQTMCVIKHRVTTGTLRGNAIQVLSGLKTGDRVVAAGARLLRDGQEVRILHKDREGHS